jgi:hypothetical protein
LKISGTFFGEEILTIKPRCTYINLYLSMYIRNWNSQIWTYVARCSVSLTKSKLPTVKMLTKCYIHQNIDYWNPMELYEVYSGKCPTTHGIRILIFIYGVPEQLPPTSGRWSESWHKIKAISGCLMPSLWWMLRRQEGDEKNVIFSWLPMTASSRLGDNQLVF